MDKTLLPLTKICTKCLYDLPLSAFGKHKKGKYGLRSICKPCSVKDTQSRYTPRPRKTNPIIDGTRECTKCHEVKPLEDFPIMRASKVGRAAACNACAAKVTEEWRQRPGNMERHQQALKTSYEKNKVERIRKVKVYIGAHPLLVAAWRKTREAKRKASPELQAYHREKTRIWDRAHPENGRQRRIRRYGIKKGIPQIETVDLNILYERDGACCSLCLGFCPREEATQDHIIPITKPGSEESYANSALAHKLCNCRKNANINLRQVFLYYQGDLAIRDYYLSEDLLRAFPYAEKAPDICKGEQLRLF